MEVVEKKLAKKKERVTRKEKRRRRVQKKALNLENQDNRKEKEREGMALYSAAEGQAMKSESRGSTHKNVRLKHFLFLTYTRWMRVGMWAWCVQFSTDLVHSSVLID